jgi:hypothetical protein
VGCRWRGWGNSDAASGKKYPELVTVFIEASRNLNSNFRDIEDANKFKNHRRLSADLTFKACKKIIHLVTLSL